MKGEFNVCDRVVTYRMLSGAEKEEAFRIYSALSETGKEMEVMQLDSVVNDKKWRAFLPLAKFLFDEAEEQTIEDFIKYQARDLILHEEIVVDVE